MDLDIKNTSELGREITVTVDAGAAAAVKSGIVEAIRASALIEGFRRGKAPASLVETRFADEIADRTVRRLIPEAYAEALKKWELNPVGEPSVGNVKLDGGFSCTISLEIKPEVALARYKGLTVKKVAPDPVTDEQVEEAIREYEKRPEFAASIIDPEKRRAWQARFRERFEYVAAAAAAAAEENQIWEQLLAQAGFPLPPRMVAERAREFTERRLRRTDLSGMSDDELKKLTEETYEKMKPVAEREVRKYFLLDRIAAEEGIAAEEADLEGEIAHLSRVAGEPADQIRKKLAESGRIEDMKDDIRIAKTFGFIKESAQMIERVVLPGEDAGAGKR